MILPKSYRAWAAALLLTCWAISVTPAAAQNTKANEGGDLAFGGFGTEPGKFIELRDITFDPTGNLYALDGARYDAKTKARKGNLRIQKFSNDGKLLGAIDLRDEATGASLGVKNDPQRLAVDARGHVYVTQPIAGQVQEFAPDGKLVRAYDVPNAMALAVWGKGDKTRIAVVASRREVIKGKWQWRGGDQVFLLTPQGKIERTIALQTPTPLEHVQDLAVDGSGNFYLQAEPNAVYVFAPTGKLLRMLGGNPTTRSEDGSELLHTVTVDAKGNVYAMTWGNPGLVTRFDADGKTVTQRAGQFQWGDPWSVHSSYTVLAIDPQDRLWAASTNVQNPKGPHFHKQRDVPAVVRTKLDFFEKPASAVKQSPVRGLGYRPVLTCTLPDNVTYETGQPIPMLYRVTPANRTVQAVTVDWHVFDAHKHEIAHGSIPLQLENGQEAKHAFAFTPTRFGSYFVLAQARSAEGELIALGEHVGVTPSAPTSPRLLEGESKGGWEDPARQRWTGLPNMRLHPAKDLDKFDADLKLADKYGMTVIVQLRDSLKHFNFDDIRAFMERFKGRIQYLEVCNEPNFSGSIDDYFKVHQQVYAIVKKIDPKVQVMGPATVNMDLNWLRRLYELGFKDVCDIVSLHDYEGHESITPEHWRWKLAEVRKIMAKHGDDAKPIWQTERAISGVRGYDFQGLVQAIRATLHRDLLEALGIPSSHNNFYYLNQGGYSSVPSYLWSKNGPHPGALALRMRHARTTALGRRFAGELDFGPANKDLFLGVRYNGDDGTTISLRNLGSRGTPLEFHVSGCTAVDVCDAWGNTEQVKVSEGKIRLTLDQLPLYVDLPRGTQLIAPKLDFGTNLAPQARFSYSAAHQGDFSLLNNGILETYHAGNPNGDTNGKKIWQGELPADARENPAVLEMTFDQPQQVERVVVRGVRPDNTFCALLEYDLQYLDGKEWKTLESIRRPMPASERARSADAVAAIWMDDTNYFLHAFAPVQTTKLRLLVRDTSHGFVPDDRARAWGNVIAQKLMLREIEVYGRK